MQTFEISRGGASQPRLARLVFFLLSHLLKVVRLVMRAVCL